MNKWCCKSFEKLLQSPQEKGMSIIARRDPEINHRAFYLQARPFEKSVVNKYSEIDPDTGFSKWPELTNEKGGLEPFTIALYFLLKNCPRCGKKLSRVIQKNKKSFDDIAEKHKRIDE